MPDWARCREKFRQNQRDARHSAPSFRNGASADGQCETMPSKWTSLPASLLLMLVLAMSWVPASAQADLEAFVKRYDDFFQAGNYDAALAEAKKFESAAKARFGTQHESYAGALTGCHDEKWPNPEIFCCGVLMG